MSNRHSTTTNNNNARNSNNNNNAGQQQQQADAIGTQLEFFISAFPEAESNIDAVRAMILVHTDGRGNTDVDAVMAGMEAIAAPKIDAPKSRTADRAAAVAAAASSGPLKMRLRPVMNGGCVGELEVSAEYLAAHSTTKKSAAQAPRFCVILDRSGSMSSNVRRIMTKILPALCMRMEIPPDEKVAVIAFDHTVQVHQLTRQEMAASRLDAGGRTNLAPGIQALGRLIAQQPDRSYRVLCISDGALHDQAETCQASSALAQQLQASVKVNVKAVRFFTSNDQPDTRGLASVLALSTVADSDSGSGGGASKLVDLSSAMEDDVVVRAMAEMFEGDGLDEAVDIEADAEILLANPWDQRGRKVLALHPGKNFIWFQRPPASLRLGSTSGGAPIDFEIAGRVSLADVSGSLKPLMDSYLQRVKVLKVVNTGGTLEEMRQILHYFEQFEDFVQSNSLNVSELLNDRSIRARLEFMRTMAARRKSSLYGLMNEIANDDKVARLSAAQQADYLRTIEGSNRNAKALARRALGSETGLDFAAVLRQEVRVMRSKYCEIAAIDDTEHAASFYSLETTKSGIKTLCEINDDDLEELSATDIIQLANIVGVPANQAAIGNVVDPMLWRCGDIYPGNFISLSDVLMHHIQSKGQVLQAPGHVGSNVNCVIPFFDDQRIHAFLHNYAPKLMELTASVNVRRVLADIPMTQAYVFAAAVWKQIEILNTACTEGNISIFRSFCRDLHSAMKAVDSTGGVVGARRGRGSDDEDDADENKSAATAADAAVTGPATETLSAHGVRGHFDHVVGYINGQLSGITPSGGKNSKKSFYIGNNGVTNMLDPLLQLCNPSKEAGFLADPERQAIADPATFNTTMQRILRALHQFEAYQVVRRRIKNATSENGVDADGWIRAELMKLLRVDPSEHSTPLQPLFVAEPKAVTHHSRCSPDTALFHEMQNKMWWVDFICLIPTALSCVSQKNPVAFMKEKWRPHCPELQCELLGLTVDDDVAHEGSDAALASSNLSSSTGAAALASASSSDSAAGAGAGGRRAAAERAYARFKRACIVQAYLFPVKAARVDEKKREMLFCDLGDAAEQQRMIEGFVVKVYASQYDKDVLNKKKLEKRQILDELVRRLAGTDSMPEFIKLLREGMTRGDSGEEVVIKDTAHQGYPMLRAKLLSLGEECPLRLRKLTVLVLGREDDLFQPVFNGGNVMIKGLEDVEAVFESLGEHTALAELRRRWKEYVRHNYRESGTPNRHTHAMDKMSYFALGFPTLEAYRAAVGDKEFREYERQHALCCGMAQLKGLCVSLKERNRLQREQNADGSNSNNRNNNNGTGNDDDQ